MSGAEVPAESAMNSLCGFFRKRLFLAAWDCYPAPSLIHLGVLCVLCVKLREPRPLPLYTALMRLFSKPAAWVTAAALTAVLATLTIYAEEKVDLTVVNHIKSE